jgi:hypothetical protein
MAIQILGFDQVEFVDEDVWALIFSVCFCNVACCFVAHGGQISQCICTFFFVEHKANIHRSIKDFSSTSK